MKSKVVINCNRAIGIAGATNGFRLDGRTPSQYRTPQILFGKSYGSCEVLLQPATRVLTQISCSVGEPMDARPNEGILTVSVWISPTATGEMGGGGSQKPALIARTLEKLFKEHRVVDLEGLCIKYAEKVWVLRADVHILDMNGCLAEAAALSVLGALLTFRRSEAYIDKETEQLVVVPTDECTPQKINLHHLPVLTSFVIANGNTILVEPDQEEEEIFHGKLMIGFNNNKELSYLHVTYPISDSILAEITTSAVAKCVERIELLQSLANEDEELRNKRVDVNHEAQIRLNGMVIQIPPSLLQSKSASSTESKLNELKNLSLLESKVSGVKSKKQKGKVKS